MRKLIAILAALIFIANINAYSQNVTNDSNFIDTSDKKEIAAKPKVNKQSKFKFLSSDELNLSYAVLIFATLVLLLEVFLIATNKVQAETSFKFIIVTLIVACSLFLITAGYNNDQIAPAFGLFGTIAGYILGKANSQDLKKDQNENKTS